jgi:peptidoglycan/LPS O-acetylase OafA/YrhL
LVQESTDRLMEQKQLSSLTATRGFAALMVVIFHFGLNCYPFNEIQRFFSKGNLAVSYFFTLSGFIMCYTYAGKEITYSAFIRKRVARIVPVYILGVILMIAFASYNLNVNNIALAKDFITDILLNLGLLQAYFPGHAISVNSPGWSLSVEMFFYLLFPYLLLLYRKNARLFFIFALCFYLLSQVSHLWLLETYHPEYETKLHEFIYYFPLNHLNEFVLGMVGYYIMQQYPNIVKYSQPLVLFIVICLALVYLPLSKHNGLLSPLFVLFTVGLSTSTNTILNNKVLVYLGEISYSVYILQMPVYLILLEINKHTLHLDDNKFFYTAIAILQLTSSFCYRFVEQPLRKRISGK